MFDDRLQRVAEVPSDRAVYSADQSDRESQVCEAPPPPPPPESLWVRLFQYVKSFYQAAETQVVQLKVDAKKAIQMAVNRFRGNAQEVLAESKPKAKKKVSVAAVKAEERKQKSVDTVGAKGPKNEISGKSEKEFVQNNAVGDGSRRVQTTHAFLTEAAQPLPARDAPLSLTLPLDAEPVLPSGFRTLAGAAIYYGVDWHLPGRDSVTDGPQKREAEKIEETAALLEIPPEAVVSEAVAVTPFSEMPAPQRFEIEGMKTQKFDAICDWTERAMGVSIGMGEIENDFWINIDAAQEVISVELRLSREFRADGETTGVTPVVSASAAAGFLVMFSEGAAVAENAAHPLIVFPAFLPVQHVRPPVVAAPSSSAATENERVLPKHASQRSRERDNDERGDQQRQRRDQPSQQEWEEESFA